MISNTFFGFGIALVLRVLDGFEKLAIAPWPAAVFGRAAAANVDQTRIEHSRLGIDEALDFDRVLPAIAEVVHVAQLFRADILKHFIEPGLARIEEVIRP